MKILWLAHDIGFGGANKCLAEHIKILKKQGFNISVIVPVKDEFANSIMGDVNRLYEIYYYPWVISLTLRQSNLFRIKKIWKNFLTTLKILWVIIKTCPDYVVTNTITIPVGAIAAKLSFTKHVWFVHEFSEEDHGYKFFCGFKKGAQLVNWLSAKVVFNSNAVMRKFSKYICKDKIFIVHNAVVLPDKIIHEKKSISYIKGVRPFKCLILGQIAPSKNQMDALKAISVLVTRGEFNIHLKIIGKVVNSYYFKELLNFIQNNSLADKVEILDHVKNPVEWIKEADVLLMCSRMEAFGRVTVEALKVGIPVIAANSGGSPEIVDDGVNGYLYEAGNTTALTEAITKLINNYSMFDKNQIAIKINEKFNEDETARELKVLF